MVLRVPGLGHSMRPTWSLPVRAGILWQDRGWMLRQSIGCHLLDCVPLSHTARGVPLLLDMGREHGDGEQHHSESQQS